MSAFTNLTSLQAYNAAEFDMARKSHDALLQQFNLWYASFWNISVSGSTPTPQGPQQFRGPVSAAMAALAPEQKLAAWGTAAVAKLALFGQLATIIVELETQLGAALYPTPGASIPGYPLYQ